MPPAGGTGRGAPLERATKAGGTPDGTLEHLGRLDDQAKVRGFRIELGEIEAVLSEHAGAAGGGVCVGGEAGRCAPRGVLCAGGRRRARPDDVRQHLRTRLPDYMVPQHFVPVERIPRRPTAKWIGGRCPGPRDEGPRDGQYVAPRTATEEIVAAIWAQVLGGGPGQRGRRISLGLGRAFAEGDAGGVAGAADAGSGSPGAELFVAPTVARLQRAVEQARTAGVGASAVPPLRASAMPGRRCCRLRSSGCGFLDQVEPTSTAYVIPRAMRWRGPVQVAVLAAALRDAGGAARGAARRLGGRRGSPSQLWRGGRVCVPLVAVVGRRCCGGAAGGAGAGLCAGRGAAVPGGAVPAGRGAPCAARGAAPHHRGCVVVGGGLAGAGAALYGGGDGSPPALPALPCSIRLCAEWQAWLQDRRWPSNWRIGASTCGSATGYLDLTDGSAAPGAGVAPGRDGGVPGSAGGRAAVTRWRSAKARRCSWC